MSNPDPSTPEPLTYKQFVKKAVKNPNFAQEVHGLVCAARNGDEQAAAKLEALVTMTAQDLQDCCLPNNLLELLNCGRDPRLIPFRTNTTTLLLDFTAMV